MNARSKINWYEEMAFLSETIASIYTYMTNQDRTYLHNLLEKLAKYYGFTLVPIASGREPGVS